MGVNRISSTYAHSKTAERSRYSNRAEGVDLHHHTQGFAFLKSNYRSWLEALDSCLVSWLKVQEKQLAIWIQTVTILATHGWECSSTPSFGHSSLQKVCDWFSNSLEKAGIDVSLVQKELGDMVEYHKWYVNLIQDDYKVVWWKIFNFVDELWNCCFVCLHPMATCTLKECFHKWN